MTIRSAVPVGDKQVITIDRLPERRSIAPARGATTTIVFINKGLILRTGRTHANRRTDDPLHRVGP